MSAAAEVEDAGTRVCPKCQRELPPEAFGGKRRCYCRDCKAAYTREYRERNHAALREGRRPPTRARVNEDGESMSDEAFHDLLTKRMRDPRCLRFRWRDPRTGVENETVSSIPTRLPWHFDH